MRLQLISDIHVERDNDLGLRFVKEHLEPDRADALVIAGDLGSYEAWETALYLICRRYHPKPVIYVTGNHEYWGGSLYGVHVHLEHAQGNNPNLIVLDQNVETILGHRFVGATGWYHGLDPKWHDFKWIVDAPTLWIPQRGHADREFFRKNVQPGDIVISHMLPTFECVAPRWRDTDTNQFFVNEMGDVIEEKKPAFWLFGHTHDHVDRVIGETRCVANPRGNPAERGNNYFNPNLILEVPDYLNHVDFKALDEAEKAGTPAAE